MSDINFVPQSEFDVLVELVKRKHFNSLRETYAGMAMQSVVRAFAAFEGTDGVEMYKDKLAQVSVDMADALIKRLGE